MAESIYIGGVTNTTMHLESDGTFHIEEKQDVEPILHYTHAMRNHRFDADACDGLMQHVAEVPFTVFQDECQKRGVSPFGEGSDLVMEAIIADPEYAYLRAAPTMRDPRIKIKGAR